MNITIENKKQKAIELMNKLDIYKPYIKGFKDKNSVCFYENFGGFWAYQEPELMAKIKEFEEKVNSHGDRWDDDINLWSGYSWEDYGREMLDWCGYNIPSELEDYIDYERYGESFKYDGIEEYSDGLIEIQ